MRRPVGMPSTIEEATARAVARALEVARPRLEDGATVDAALETALASSTFGSTTRELVRSRLLADRSPA